MSPIKNVIATAPHYIFIVSASALMLTPTSSIADSGIFQANLERTGVYNDMGPENSPELVWKFDTNSPVLSTPLINEESVYVSDFEGGVYALDKKLGEVKWNHEMGGRASFQISLSTDSLLVGRHPFREDDESYLLAMDIESGEELWRYWDNDLSALDSPTVYRESIFLTSMHDYLYALELENGREKWKFPIQGGTRQPLLSSNILYFQDNTQAIYALSPDSGDLLWSYIPESSIENSFSTPAIDNCCIYAMMLAEESGSIIILDKYTGELRTEFPIQFRSNSSISLLDGIAFFGDDGEGHENAHGYMNAMDIESGELIWRFETGGFVRGAASISGNTVYFGSGDHHLYAVDRYTGELKWRYETGGPVTSTPAIVDGRIYFGSIDGHVYVLE
ncbi:PQQ-binding-like beta-propeller repeat protein [Vreelandella olivaria]|uniref:outer membrane protein assembly factor BamB family protein n=1 Tax=Vreelandella olivaria TaxID=390919 RepID=UPI00201EEB2A|nr:PQQ-binding-like beta-propeller repeat protein [Halomonas olivaria]